MPRVSIYCGVALAALHATTVAARGRGGGESTVPSWLDDDGKDIFSDLESEQNVYGASACELRDKLLPKMAGKNDPGATDHRAKVLVGQGMCELKNSDYDKAKKRLESAISEIAPSEDQILKHPQLAHIGFLKQGVTFLTKNDISQAGTSLRRSREIIWRNLKKILKMIHGQIEQKNPGQAPPLDILYEEMAGYGKTGQALPKIREQVPALFTELAFAEVLDAQIDDLDMKITAVDAGLKKNKERLDTSRGKSMGTLMYVRALTSDVTAPAERSGVAQELMKNGAIKAFSKVTASKGSTLVQKLSEGSGCKDGLETLCQALMKVPDIASNVFGETRILALKKGKKQRTEICSTNANLAVLVANVDGVKLSTGEPAQAAASLVAEVPIVADFCRGLIFESDVDALVLFAQFWHPEFAAVERTSELRARSEVYSLSEDSVKAATKIANDAAKKNWEKYGKQWRQGSEGLKAINGAFEKEKQDAKEKLEQAEEAKRREQMHSSDDLEELQKKREQRKLKEAQAEQKRLARKKQLEEERANRDPWLNFPAVIEMEKNIEELKEARRDANAKLEFEDSTQLTKDISTAERAIKRIIKKAKKEYKKHGGPAPKSEADLETDAEKTIPEGAKKNAEAEALRKELEDVKVQKKEAAKSDNFKVAKTLKAKQQELEEKLKKLEL